MNKLTDQQKIDVVNEYVNLGISTVKLAKKYNINQGSISKLLKRRGVKIRGAYGPTQSFNENYFEKIDSEDKAYFLGLMYADGNCRSSQNSASIALKYTDKEILDKFREFLGHKKELSFVKRKRKDSYKCNGQYLLRMCSKKNKENLIMLGCVPAKSLILEFPTDRQVPKYLLKHFIRGYYDGDGGIIFAKGQKQMSCNITSTVMFCERLKEILAEILGINIQIIDIKSLTNKKNKVTKRLIIAGNRQVKIFLDWLYKDSIIFMERKLNRYKELTKLSKPIKIYNYGTKNKCRVEC